MRSFFNVALICSVLGCLSTRAAPWYIATELRFPAANAVSVSDLNDHGTAVGSIWRGGLQRGFIANPQRVVFLERFFPQTNTAALRINNRGEVIGCVADATAPDGWRWFIYRHSKVKTLDVIDGQTILDVADINDRGEFIGHCTPGAGVFTFIYTSGKLVTLSQLPGRDRGHPWMRLNNHGQVVSYDDYGGKILTTNSVIDIGFENNSTGINDRGDVIGMALIGQGNQASEAGYLFADGEQHLIASGMPNAVNEKRQVVGQEYTEAYLADIGGWLNLNFFTINTHNLHLNNATAINRRSVIACNGMREERSCAFILVPVPRRYLDFWRANTSTVPSYVTRER